MSMKKIAPFFIALCMHISALPAFAQTADTTPEPEYTPMMKESYEKLLTGKTITGEYRFLRELTKTYDFSETHNADGTTDYTEGQIRSKGIWYVLGEQKICYKYPNDENMGGRTSCFWVYKSEDCYYGYSLNQMTLNGPRNYDNWGARWVLKGSGGSCAAATG